mmetsp:Transcript_2457/g.5358  ORF Transcript_2457/g.5358 Transcript_2457/m.5358 type:complete len:373 (-) Transcript_2457:358-1476(-)
MGKDKKKSKLCCTLTTVCVLAIVGAMAWYFLVFAKDTEDTIADCGGCYCIPDNTTSFQCPSTAAPPTSYPEESHLNAWKSQTIINPYVLNCNPYTDGVFCDTEPPLDPDYQWAKLDESAVCAVHYQGEQDEPEQRGRGLQEEQQQDNGNCENTAYYRIKTYPSRDDAENAGGFVTHVGHCGVCSALQDLAVYANIDFVGITSPGNFCRRQAATSFENGLSCYLGLGMTQDCAKLWADTSWNTARNCFGSCVVNPTLPQFGGGGEVGNSTDFNSTESSSSDNWYNLPVILRNRFSSSLNKTESGSSVPSNGPSPECALNTCITCNDDVSAPTFERFAGRSRRRSGLVSTAARPCGSIPKIDHYPCPTTKPLAE